MVTSRSGRREIIDYYIDKKAHVPELDKEERRDQLAAMTFGYTPVMIEHLFDEALVWSLRDGRAAMDWHDVQQAKMTEEIGLKRSSSTPKKAHDRTHEAGHATVAHLVGQNCKLGCSIIKQRRALGCSRTATARSASRAPVGAARHDEDRIRRDVAEATLRRVGYRRRPRREDRGPDGRLLRMAGSSSARR
jgi:ATP-dependent Zn protease